MAAICQEGSFRDLATQVAVERVAEVEARSAGLRKELGLIDLVLMQILYVVGSGWVGTAAKLGPSHTVFWLLAIVAYYLPQAAVVIYLSRLMPLEGGLYQWTQVGLGKFAGFMVAWNLWSYAVLIMATFGVTIATNASYLLAGETASLSQLWWYTPVVSTLSLLIVTASQLSAGQTGAVTLRTGRTILLDRRIEFLRDPTNATVYGLYESFAYTLANQFNGPVHDQIGFTQAAVGIYWGLPATFVSGWASAWPFNENETAYSLTRTAINGSFTPPTSVWAEASFDERPTLHCI